MTSALCLVALALVATDLRAQTTPLTRAIRTEDFAEARKLMTKESVNEADVGLYHPLTYAVYTGDVGLVKSLLEAGANPNVIESNGKTALYAAAHLSHTQLIGLLKQHGARVPMGDSALAPLSAAVLSRSVESLKTLLKHFPDLDVNQGWRPVTSEYPYEGVQGNAVGYAAMRADNEIALLLLEKGANPAIRSQLAPAADGSARNRGTQESHRNALHFAARDARCSAKLVAALIAAGLDPMDGPSHFGGFDHVPDAHPIGGVPRAPLDLAAAAGSLEKVRIMVAGRDAQNYSVRITRAAYFAAFHNRRETSKFLFGLLGRTLPNIDDWPREPRASRTQSAKPRTTGAPMMDPSTLLPRSSAPQASPELAGTLAVISPESLRNFASLLTVALGKADTIQLVERDAIDNAIRENSLKALRSGDSDAFHQQLDLIPAEHLLIVSDVGAAKDKLLQYALVTTRNGLVAALIVIPKEKAVDPQAVEKISQQLLEVAQSSAAIAKHAVAISHLSVKPSRPSEQTLHLANLVDTLIPHYVSNTPGCVLLSRSQLQHLETEKTIGVQGAYWASAWIVDGGIDVNENGAHLTLRATNPADSRSVQVDVSGPIEAFSPVISDAWQQLTRKIDLKPTKEADQRPPSADEFAFLAQRAQWLLQADYHEEALDLSNSSLALGDTSLSVRLTSLRASMIAVSKQLMFLLRVPRLRINPRSLAPRDKYPLTRYFGSHLDLANRAISYLQTPDVAKRSPREVQVVERVLHRLILFRTLMDDSIVETRFGPEIRSLDIKIAQLTKLYMAKADRFYHVTRVLSKSLYYYERHAPDSLRVILERISRNSRRDYRLGDPSLHRITFSRRVREVRKLGLSVEPWADLFEVMMKSTQHQHRVCGLGASIEFAETHEERERLGSQFRLELFRYVLAPRKAGLHGDNLPIEIIGCEHDRWKGLTEGIPSGGLATVIRDFKDDWTHTGEFRRLFGSYVWLGRIQQFSNKIWAHDIGAYRQSIHFGHQSSGSAPQLEDWVILRKIAQSRGPLGREALDQFNAMLPSKVEPRERPAMPLGKALPLADIGTNPSDATFSEIIKSVVVGDQVWLPVFSFGKEGTEEGKSPSSKSCIQVMTIPSGDVRTVPLPTDCTLPYRTKTFNRWEIPTGLIVADDYVYYPFYDRDNQSRLFAINRETFKLREIILPLKHILTVTRNAVDNTVYASLVPSLRMGRMTNIVVAVKGGEIVETLVSNERIPAQSPLDSPEVLVTKLLSTSGNLRLFSAHERSYTEPSRVKTINYDPEDGKWEKLPPGWGKRPRTEHLNWVTDHMRADNEAFYADKWITLGDKRYSFPGHGLGLDGELLIASAAVVENFQIREGLHVGKQESFDSVRLHVTPVKSPIFDIEHYRLREVPVRGRVSGTADKITGKNYSANEMIREGRYNSYVIGRWNDQFVIGLHKNYRGVPAVWLAKEDTVKDHMIRRKVPTGSGSPPNDR